jgi:peptide-methionine (S)-S-oxide reductase
MERKATFGAGRFWTVEAAFRRLDGVVATTVGYAGGTVGNPTYEQVSSRRTGHAQVVEVAYDPDRIGYGRLLEVFWSEHDPTQLNRQGADVGDQFRSAIFVHDEEQRAAAEASRERVQLGLNRPIVTLIQEVPRFWPAEEYHQHYLEKRVQARGDISLAL